MFCARELSQLKGLICFLLGSLAVGSLTEGAFGQAVCLPAPRLLTTMPMGGQAGTVVDVTITGQSLEDVETLVFSHPGLTASPVNDDAGKVIPNRFAISIAADCPPGIYEARAWSRLGLSTSRVFSVGSLPEVTQDKPSTTLETAFPLKLNSICNATAPVRAANHYSFQASQGQRILVDCAAKGIDSKLIPVVVIADDQGQDLLVERRGGALDFTAPRDGTYTIKVHELTFQGGSAHFYRLGLWSLEPDEPIERLPQTRNVNAFSWPPVGLSEQAAVQEVEADDPDSSQTVSLPCDVAGRFYPAADVDLYEFHGKQGEEWWIEVASERLGRPTDPVVVVQRASSMDGKQQWIDVLELDNIDSPVKRSSNGYAYDGPPYNAGSADVLGKLVLPEEGHYRLKISDLFGGTRNDPENRYRLVIRKAAPDFALVAWALHMELRNGDRNALSKPMALRGGATMALEVVAVRRDGFAGDIELSMENLPDGVTATGLKIPAGQSRGIVLVTADQEAPRGMRKVMLRGKAIVNGQQVVRPCHLASMAWPIPNSWSESRDPRLVSEAYVSVGGSEFAPLSLVPHQRDVWEVQEGGTLRIPMKHLRREAFSGNILGLKTFGAGFENNARFEVAIDAEESEAVLDLAKLKTPPGEYKIAFYGSAVAKYRYNPEGVAVAEQAHQAAEQRVKELAEQVARLGQAASAVSQAEQASAQQALAEATRQKQAAEAALAAAAKRLTQATQQAKPKDIADIVVSEPVTIRVLAKDSP